jgi:polar amino acid transport system substrate-binding protein
MRKLIPITFAVFIIASGYLALRLVPSTNPRPPRPVKLASSEWEPFIGPDLENNGPMAIIVSETVQRMGYEPEISFASWELIQEQTSRAEVLGAFPLILSSERIEKYSPSDPILEFEYVLFYNRQVIKNPDEIKSVVDIAGRNYRFGKVKGYDVWPELADVVQEFDEEYTTSADAFQALAAGEIDFLPEGRLAGLFLLQGSDILVDANLFGILETPDNSGLSAREGLHFLMPNTVESERFLEAFNTALAQVKETPIYDEALSQIETSLLQESVVELQPISGEMTITVVDSVDESISFHVPLGTQAVVIEWNETMLGETSASTPMQPLYSTVKLLNGPQQGRVVFVDIRAIKLMH